MGGGDSTPIMDKLLKTALPASPRARLEAFIRQYQHGGCKMLLIGDACECPLCDLDRVAAQPQEQEPK